MRSYLRSRGCLLLGSSYTVVYIDETVRHVTFSFVQINV